MKHTDKGGRIDLRHAVRATLKEAGSGDTIELAGDQICVVPATRNPDNKTRSNL
ncbi:MAG: hypothetical protein QNK19_16325 [Xanthomonadales bacterium]|nr:hypothetical protein [Xanthomonadales bacterium]